MLCVHLKIWFQVRSALLLTTVCHQAWGYGHDAKLRTSLLLLEIHTARLLDSDTFGLHTRSRDLGVNSSSRENAAANYVLMGWLAGEARLL